MMLSQNYSIVCNHDSLLAFTPSSLPILANPCAPDFEARGFRTTGACLRRFALRRSLIGVTNCASNFHDKTEFVRRTEPLLRRCFNALLSDAPVKVANWKPI
jgi:hypothetical protein